MLLTVQTFIYLGGKSILDYAKRVKGQFLEVLYVLYPSAVGVLTSFILCWIDKKKEQRSV